MGERCKVTGDGQPFIVSLQARSDRFDALDERWREQVTHLYADLRRGVDGFRVEAEPVPGTKGGVEAVVLALGSAGAFAGALEAFRAWLGRDRSRSLEISWTVDGKEESVVVWGAEIDQAALKTLAEAAARRIGNPDRGRPG